MKLEPIPDIVKKNFDDDSIVYNTDTHMYYGNETNQNIISDIRNNAMQIYGGYYIFEKGKGWNSPKIYLTGRGESSGKFKIKLQNFKPYCYEYDENGDYKTYLDEPCRKIIFTGVHPWFVKRYREQRRRKKGRIPYEADILFVRRFLCDMYDYFKPTKAIQPEVAIIDIETNFPVNDDIIAFSLNNMKDYLYYESKFETSNPYVLALSLFDQLKPYDWVTGWNVKFDIKITMNHLEKIQDIWNFINSSNNLITIDDLVNRQINSFTRIQLEEIVNELVRQGYLIKHEDIIITDKDFDYDISHMLAIVDLLVISKKMHAREIRGKWSLDNVGMKLCGIGKRHIGATKIKDLKQDELFEYNCLDVIIPEIIDATLGGLEGHNILSWSLQSIVEDTLITAVVNDIALIRAYHKQKIVLPSRDYSKQKAKGETYDAADPDARHGFYKGIIATDLVHAYPWAVLSKNTSCESKCDDGVNIVQFINKNGEERIIRFNNNKSTFIKTLQEIMDERGKIKKKLNTLTKGSNDWQTYKSIDFALKTQAAAFSHGIFGWENSRMYDLDVADAITAIVRELIVKIKDACDLIGRRWVYAHSITPDTSLLLQDRSSGWITIKNIKDIENDYHKYMVWTEGGWSNIKQFIKHKSIHEIYRINTRNGLVKVTSCHSLLNELGEEVTPKELNIGDKLLHMKHNEVRDVDDIHSEDLAWLFGLFIAEGSCGNYNCPSGKKSSWAINNKDISLLKKAGNILSKEYNIGYKIDDTIKSSGVYKLRPFCEKQGAHTIFSTKDLVNIFLNDCYDDKEKKVPDWILNSNNEIIRAFLSGYNEGDGTHNKKYKNEFVSFKTKSNILAHGLTILLSKIDLDYTINLTSNGKQRKYYQIWVIHNKNHYNLKHPNEIKEIEIIDNDYDYVYDLETENHHFQAGIGCMIVHNTDSCFVNAPKDEANKVLEYLNKVIFDHCKGYRTKPNLDYQDYYNMAYIHTAARKVMIPEDGNIDDVDSWEVTGMNMMRSETPEPLAEIEINILKSKFKDKTNSVILDEVREEIRDLRLKDSTELATIKPLTKPLHEYGKTLLDGSHGNIPYHIKSLMRASDEYGFTVNVGEKFGILPIITDEYTGKRIKKRKRVFIAFDTETGLPDNYIIDYTSYLKSNLWGKICKILDMTSKELEKEVMTEHVKSALFVGVL